MIATLILCAACLDVAWLGKIESNNNDQAIGTNGERGRYQMTLRAWGEVTKEPFKNAHNKQRATVNAMKYLNLSSKRFQQRTGRKPTDKELWMVWNMGLDGSLTRKPTHATKRGLTALTK